MTMTRQAFLAKLLRDPVFREEWRTMTHDGRKAYLVVTLGITSAEAAGVEAFEESPAPGQPVLTEIARAIETSFWG